MNKNINFDDFLHCYKIIRLGNKKIILNPGDKIDYIYYIKNGFIRSYAITETGDDITLNIFKAGSYIPLTLVLSKKTNQHFYETITKTQMYKIPTKDFIKYLTSNKKLLFEFSKKLSSGTEGLLTRIQFLLRSNSEQKVAASLYLLVKRFGKRINNNSAYINIPQTHQDIANLSGISRETTSITLKKLELVSIIKRKSKFWIILDVKGLIAITKTGLNKKTSKLSY